MSRGVTGAWVATNCHVVASQSRVCVMTADRLTFPAQVLPEIKEKLQGTVDLALIWLPGDEKVAIPAAVIKDEPLLAEDLPLVVATGFPTPSNRSVNGPHTANPRDCSFRYSALPCRMAWIWRIRRTWIKA